MRNAVNTLSGEGNSSDVTTINVRTWNSENYSTITVHRGDDDVAKTSQKESTEKKYDAVFLQKKELDGLTLVEIQKMYALLNEEEAFPVEIEPYAAECSAQGFITNEGANKLDYDMNELRKLLAPIMDDVRMENSLGEYTFADGLTVLMVYDL